MLSSLSTAANMAQSFKFLLLLLLFMYIVHQSNGTLFDLEDVIYEILLRSCSYNERLATFDVTGDNKTRGPHKNFDTYPPVKFNVGRVVYQSAKIQSLKLSAVYVQMFHNNQSDEEGKAYISEQIDHEDEYMWSVTRGADFTAKAKFSISVPLIYQFSTEFSTTVKTSSGSTTTETRTTRQLIKQDIKIPPGATIEAKWYVNEAQVVVPWVADISFEGYVAALYETPDKKLTWKYLNVQDFEHEHLKKHGKNVTFQALGLFQANVAQSYHLSTSQKKLAQRTASLAKYTFEQETS
uniref:Putative salivary secreted protein n=1 Tax=Ixodes scapularis TaxID=6945 RepID=Q4PN44_IXOSC|nr:putative salivary secreted protein [Ixodes scapularis]